MRRQGPWRLALARRHGDACSTLAAPVQAMLHASCAGKPYADAAGTWTTEWNGIKVGVVGLVEEEWLDTLGAVNTAEVRTTAAGRAGQDSWTDGQAQHSSKALQPHSSVAGCLVPCTLHMEL